jgi:hypothetical protein
MRQWRGRALAACHSLRLRIVLHFSLVEPHIAAIMFGFFYLSSAYDQVIFGPMALSAYSSSTSSPDTFFTSFPSSISSCHLAAVTSLHLLSCRTCSWSENNGPLNHFHHGNPRSLPITIKMALFRLLAKVLFPTALLTQACYYPNGNPVTAEPVAPCNTTSTNAVMCCPLNWTCLSNLLCSKPDEGLLGRYSCTDSHWDSPACPSFCTKSKRPGNRMIFSLKML